MDLSFRSSVTCLSFNAAGKLGSPQALHGFVLSASLSYPSWAVIFVQELDFLQTHSNSCIHVDGHVVYRHWPGAGSRTLGIIVNRLYKGFVCNLK